MSGLRSKCRVLSAARTGARIRGCSPLITPKKNEKSKNRAVRQSAQTLFRFFGFPDLYGIRKEPGKWQ
nr:MAG TPA: hypothetical protein [Caudoviricetes sp.]